MADDLVALARGDLVPDDANLVRLLTGFWSAEDVPSSWDDHTRAWFPGGGTPALPHAHALDRY